MNIKQKAISGIKWTTISTLSLAVTELLKISILARYLDKEDFGLMALVTFVLGFTNLFVDMGLTSAILHKQDISKNEYASLYWLNFGFSIILFVIIIFYYYFFSSTCSRALQRTRINKIDSFNGFNNYFLSIWKTI